MFFINGFAQNFNINKYKYVIVDSQFDFAKEPDQYKLSTLTKFLFNKIGMHAFIDTDSYPEELSKDACLALFASAYKKSGLLTLKTVIEIKDCFGRTLFTSEIGKSKTKEFARGYYQTISRAFASIERLNYKYDESYVDKTPKKVIELKKEPSVKKKPVLEKKIKVVKEVKPKVISKANYILLYGKKTQNGFQLVNTKSEVLFSILKTSHDTIFIIKDINGILEKKGDFWIAEYYKNGNLIIEKYQIKF